MEDEFFGQFLFAPPNRPTNAGVDKAIFVAADIDAFHQR